MEQQQITGKDLTVLEHIVLLFLARNICAVVASVIGPAAVAATIAIDAAAVDAVVAAAAVTLLLLLLSSMPSCS